MQRMEAECWIFMLFFRLRMLSEDWYTWMLPSRQENREIRLLLVNKTHVDHVGCVLNELNELNK